MKRTKTEYTREGLVIARDYEKCLSSMCHHVSNDEYYGRPFLLEEFQRENIWKPIFATGSMVEKGETVDGRPLTRFERRFRRAIIGLPSGLGKTELAAALVLTVATMEVRYNGQYGVVASSKDQVRNIFEKIATMIKLNETWSQQWAINKDVIVHRETGAKIMVLPNKADALESWHFNVLIFDELHVYKDDKVWAAGIKGQKVLDQPLAIGITTAGDSREGFLWNTLALAENDPGMYVYWLGLDDKDSINSRKAWEKLMVASWVTWESIQDQRNSASSKRAFERYTANRFPTDKNEYSCFTETQIKACSRSKNEFDLDKPFAIGIDGATSGDSYAIVAYQERKDKNGKIQAYTKEWVFDEPTEKGRYDLVHIMELVADLYQTHYPYVVGIDPNRMIVMAQQLESTYGVEIVSFAQNNPTMCQATSLVIASVKDKTLHLKGCPKLQRHLLNTIEDDKDSFGVRFGKDAKKSKIDAAIALAIASLAYNKLVRGNEDAVPVM